MAPRLTLRLIDEIERQSKRRLPIAELNRRVGEAAAEFGLTKPSYERVRVLVHQARSLRRAGPDSFSTVALDVLYRAKPPHALMERVSAGPRLRLRDVTSPPK